MMLRARVLTIFAAGILGGCATIDGCEIFSPIAPSVKDRLTEQTERQITAHNETGEAVCGWKP